MGPGDTMAVLVTIILPTIAVIYLFRRWFGFKEKQLETQLKIAAQNAAQYAASNTQLEQRVRVLEQIVTDRGVETAAQIEALRSSPRLIDAG